MMKLGISEGDVLGTAFRGMLVGRQAHQLWIKMEHEEKAKREIVRKFSHDERTTEERTERQNRVNLARELLAEFHRTADVKKRRQDGGLQGDWRNHAETPWTGVAPSRSSRKPCEIPQREKLGGLKPPHLCRDSIYGQQTSYRLVTVEQTTSHLTRFSCVHRDSFPFRSSHPSRGRGLSRHEPQTLAVWHTTHRYHLPLIKVGTKVRYRRADLGRLARIANRRRRGARVRALISAGAPPSIPAENGDHDDPFYNGAEPTARSPATSSTALAAPRPAGPARSAAGPVVLLSGPTDPAAYSAPGSASPSRSARGHDRPPPRATARPDVDGVAAEPRTVEKRDVADRPSLPRPRPMPRRAAERHPRQRRNER